EIDAVGSHVEHAPAAEIEHVVRALGAARREGERVVHFVDGFPVIARRRKDTHGGILCNERGGVGDLETPVHPENLLFAHEYAHAVEQWAALALAYREVDGSACCWRTELENGSKGLPVG